jgi:hypothetical protein
LGRAQKSPKTAKTQKLKNGEKIKENFIYVLRKVKKISKREDKL